MIITSNFSSSTSFLTITYLKKVIEKRQEVSVGSSKSSWR